MRAREIMNGFFVAMGATEPIQTAVDAMVHDRVGVVCVCDERGAPIGVITDRDIVARVCFKRLSCEETTVGSVMTPNPLTCSAESPMETVGRDMERRGVGRVLVTDDAGLLIGIITLAEIWHSESPMVAGAMSRRITGRELRVEPTGGHYDSARPSPPGGLPTLGGLGGGRP